MLTSQQLMILFESSFKPPALVNKKPTFGDEKKESQGFQQVE